MTAERNPTAELERTRICAREACGRHAEERFCDVCALEWSLFHWEEKARETASESRGAR